MGSGTRYLVSVWATRTFTGGPFLGTILVNIVGSLLLGWLMRALKDTDLHHLRLLLGTGFMGGFTTYSTFNLETLQMLERSQWLPAIAYLTTTWILCLAAGAFGWLYLGR